MSPVRKYRTCIKYKECTVQCKTFIHTENDSIVYMDGNHGKHSAEADVVQKKNNDEQDQGNGNKLL